MRQMSFTWMAVAASWPVLPSRRVLGRLLQACHLDVGRNHLLKVVADRDFARLATFLLEVEHPLVAGVVEISAGKPGAGSRAGRAGTGIGEYRQNGAIAQAHGA
jgi:hypothetical protein